MRVQFDVSSDSRSIAAAELQMVGPVPLVATVLHQLASKSNSPYIVRKSSVLHDKHVVDLEKESFQVQGVPFQLIRVRDLAVLVMRLLRISLCQHDMDKLICLSHSTLPSPSVCPGPLPPWMVA